MTTTDTTQLAPVVCTVEVPVEPTRAFTLFTSGIATWWPLESHACDTDTAVSCVLEPHVGGSLHEVDRDGATAPWGTVTTYDPPRAVAFTWHPGREPESAQDVTVEFTPTEAGTLVTLTHSNWGALGDRAAAVRESYVTGWALVLGERFTRRAGIGDAR